MPVSPHAHALLAGCFAAMVLELAQVLAPRAGLYEPGLPVPPNHGIEDVYRALPDYTEGFVPMHLDDLIRLKTALVRRTTVNIGAQLWNDLHGTLRFLQLLSLSEEDMEHLQRVLVAHGLAKYDEHGQFAVRQSDYV
jgi:hypothetical protein